MHVLVYIRRSEPFNKSVLSFAREKIRSSKISTVSEYFNGDFRIDMNSKENDYDVGSQKFLEEHVDISEVIFRDRVLRNTPYSECLVLIRRAIGQLLNIFKKGGFESLVTYPVDNYIMDLMIKVASVNGVACYGVCSFFIEGYKRQTVYGEHCPSREVADDEADDIRRKLQSNFRSHMAPSRKKALRSALIRYLKYKLRYPIFYLLFHKVFKRNEYDLMCTPFNTTVRNFSNFFVERFFIKENRIDYSKKSILVPLHYFPEATVEYWTNDILQVEFEDMLRCRIEELSERYEQIILKEHPATLFDNPSGFYRELLKNSKVVLIDPFISTSLLLQKVDTVGCWTGTIGIEALVSGKKVELFSDGQYYKEAMDLIPDTIEKKGSLVSINNPTFFLKEILKGCFKVD